MPFIDHFGSHADDYQRFRPAYPAALFQFLADHTPNRMMAWDVGTGNGQAAASLAAHFQHVLGTDGSLDQLCAGTRRHTALALAEQAPLGDASVDLVTVAQALHWFDLEAFYVTVRRVLRPDGRFAAWTYALPSVDDDIDDLIVHFHDEVVGPHWPARRQHVIRGYRDLPFPFDRIQTPTFAVTVTWTRDELLGYLGTWSAAQRYRRAYGNDPLELIRRDLSAAWGTPQSPRSIRWPMALHFGVARAA